MENGRVHQYASKRLTAWSRQSLPGWWTMLTVVIGVGFFLYLAHSMISTDNEPATTLPPLTAGPQERPGSAAAEADAVPTPEARIPPGSSDPVRVTTWDGRSVTVPAEALAVAELAFRALTDPAAAAVTPTADGSVLPAPAETHPDATVTQVKLAGEPDKRQLLFSALVDVDGSGPRAATPVYRNLALVAGRWAVLPTAG